MTPSSSHPQTIFTRYHMAENVSKVCAESNSIASLVSATNKRGIWYCHGLARGMKILSVIWTSGLSLCQCPETQGHLNSAVLSEVIQENNCEFPEVACWTRQDQMSILGSRTRAPTSEYLMYNQSQEEWIHGCWTLQCNAWTPSVSPLSLYPLPQATPMAHSGQIHTKAGQGM